MENMGPYKLESVLGRGGMGTVYKANDSVSGELLAVKVLAPAYSTDDHFRNRFESEIKALLKLDHPNIVRLIGYGQEDNNLYFAMELVQGRSLFQLQRDGLLFDWREVIRIAKNVALGLRHAHDRGVIHRDLKPGNLLKADTGIVKITDFGIAKRFGQDQNTGTNVLGTLDFMSPEQAKGQPVTFRSDLYSLGTVMYTLLAGRPPFTSSSFEESMRNLTKVPAPRITRNAPGVPSELDDLISQLLAKDPSKRIQTALSLYHQLKQVEQNLLDTSQAKTAEHVVDSDKISASEKTYAHRDEPSTSVDRQRMSGHTVFHESVDRKMQTDSNSGPAKSNQPTQLNSIHNRSRENQQSVEQEDFFNTVTETERKKQVNSNIEQKSSHSSIAAKLVTAALLTVVIGLGCYGFVRATRKPPAEVLLAEIYSDKDEPQKFMDQINQFLDYYPEHEQMEDVSQLRELARCNQLINRFRIRPKHARPLTKIEQGFFDITKVADKDSQKAVGLLAAFLTLYGTDQSLDERDHQSVEAANVFLEKVKKDAENQIVEVRRDFERQLERAKSQPDDKAIAIYKSLVELNSEFDWVSDLIENAQTQIQRLESENK